MKLYSNGITVEAEHPGDIARLRKAGYVEVAELKQEEPKQEPKPAEKQDVTKGGKK